MTSKLKLIPVDRRQDSGQAKFVGKHDVGEL